MVSAALQGVEANQSAYHVLLVTAAAQIPRAWLLTWVTLIRAKRA